MFNLKPILLAALFFFAGFLVLYDQYRNIGIWFQIKDIHHETFALSAFALAIGITAGMVLTRKRN